MKFDINNYKGKYVMHCKTEEEAKEFCSYLRLKGVPTVGESVWRWYRTNTCYNLNYGTYADVEFYTREGFTILEWSDFTTEFTKADLKDGMIVEFANGKRFMVLDNDLISHNTYMGMKDYDDSLNYKYNPDNKINKIYKSKACFFREIFDDDYLTLIWERKTKPKPVEMTLAEVCKALGKEIKIVKE